MNKFTKKETIERIQEARRYLERGVRSRAAYSRVNMTMTPRGYVPTEIESSFSAPPLEPDYRNLLISGAYRTSREGYGVLSLIREKIMFRGTSKDFVESFGTTLDDQKASFGEVFDIVTTPFHDPGRKEFLSGIKPRKIAISFCRLWIGTPHHAPIGYFTWCDRPGTLHTLEKYTDLL